MKRRFERKLPQQLPADIPPEVQQGTSGRGPGKDERLKQQARQHPQRDEPRVDSVEPGETPR